jgi:hypothetical protein
VAIVLRDLSVPAFGTTFPSAYAKIDRVMIDLERKLARVDVRVYVDEAARRSDADGRSVMGVDKHSMEIGIEDLGIDADAIKAACYAKLKTDDRFKGGKDA